MAISLISILKNPKKLLVEKLVYGVIAKSGYQLIQIDSQSLITRPIDTSNVEILLEQNFQQSVTEAGPYTLLDTPRLANLWSLCRMSDQQGAIMEIGTYRGGGALHLSNSNPNRKVILCDSFESFEEIDAQLDKVFAHEQFADTQQKRVESLFKKRNRDYEIIPGFFPHSAANKKLPAISFVHLDVDVYKATLESLQFLLGSGLMCAKSLIVLDDFNRNADGVMQAVKECLEKYPNWQLFPLFPSQGLLIPNTWL